MLSDDDIAYVRAHFVALDTLPDPDGVRAHIAAGRLPGPAYVLPDGTEMVAPGHLALADAAGGPEHLREWFLERLPDEAEWAAYLSGEYAVCLREVTPESIRRKGELMAAIEELVDELDALLRPFAAWDRVRFGGPVSRDRLVTRVRERYLRTAPAPGG
jgi:hypothetical protein